MTKLKGNYKNFQLIQIKAGKEKQKQKNRRDKQKLNYKIINFNLAISITSFKY